MHTFAISIKCQLLIQYFFFLSPLRCALLGLFIRIRTAAIITIVAIVDRIKASKQRQRSSVINYFSVYGGS